MSFILPHGHIKLEQLMAVTQELATGSDRAVAIVGGALIETILTYALISRFHKNEKITDQLFRSTGALGSFSTKVDMSFLTGLCGPKAYRDLVTVKDIEKRLRTLIESGQL